MTSFTKYGSLTALALLVVLGFQNCSQFSGDLTESSLAKTDVNLGVASVPLKGKYSDKSPHKCVKTGEKCFSETFQQPVKNTKAVDVLFVIQTSEAISAERLAIVSGIKGFISSLPSGSNFNIAVMLAHGSTSRHSGRLFRAETEPLVLKSSELSNTQIQTYLDLKLNDVEADPQSGGGEEGLFSLFNGIATPALLAESQSLGFFRPEAALAVVFVADRRDICAVVPAGVPPEADPIKVAARIRDCEGLTAAGLTARLAALKGLLPVAVSGIIYTAPPVPAGNEIGYGYTDMIALNAGVAIDIENDNIEAGLAVIAELSSQQMEIKNRFVLEYTGIDSRQIIVTVNGVGATYILDGNTVRIKSKIPPGAVVVIAYCLKSKPGTKGCYRRTHKH